MPGDETAEGPRGAGDEDRAFGMHASGRCGGRWMQAHQSRDEPLSIAQSELLVVAGERVEESLPGSGGWVGVEEKEREVGVFVLSGADQAPDGSLGEVENVFVRACSDRARREEHEPCAREALVAYPSLQKSEGEGGRVMGALDDVRGVRGDERNDDGVGRR